MDSSPENKVKVKNTQMGKSRKKTGVFKVSGETPKRRYSRASLERTPCFDTSSPTEEILSKKESLTQFKDTPKIEKRKNFVSSAHSPAPTSPFKKVKPSAVDLFPFGISHEFSIGKAKKMRNSRASLSRTPLIAVRSSLAEQMDTPFKKGSFLINTQIMKSPPVEKINATNATFTTCIEDVEEKQNFDVTYETLETRTPQMENSLKTSDVTVIVNTDPLKKETSLIDTYYSQQIEELSATGTEAEEKQNYIQTEPLQTRTPSMARNSTTIYSKSMRKTETPVGTERPLKKSNSFFIPKEEMDAFDGTFLTDIGVLEEKQKEIETSEVAVVNTDPLEKESSLIVTCQQIEEINAAAPEAEEKQNYVQTESVQTRTPAMKNTQARNITRICSRSMRKTETPVGTEGPLKKSNSLFISEEGMNAFHGTFTSDIEVLQEMRNFTLVSNALQVKSPLKNLQKRKSVGSPFGSSVKKFKMAIFSADSPVKNSLIPESSSQIETQIEDKKQKREIVRAKRLMRQKPNDSTSGTCNEENTEFKKKRKLWQKQDNFDTGSFPTENGEITHEEEQITEKEEIPVIEIIDLVAEDDLQDEKTRLSSFNITKVKNQMSPSTSIQNLEDKSMSPIENMFHFETFGEELHPSTRGGATLKRRTYELENSVNDVSVLKTASEQDSRINSLLNEETELPLSDEAAAFSKVTLRRKLNKDDFGVRISKTTPPWESIENDISLEASTPMAAKNMRYSLLRDVLTKEKLTGARLRKHRTSSVDSGAMSTADVTHLGSSMKKTLSTVSLIEGTTDLRNSTQRTPHTSFENVSTSKKNKGSSVKIPDFAAIHKRNFDKMESIDDYKRRKDERAKKLLSGRKPPVDKTPKEQTKKMLRFDSNMCEKPKPANFIPLPSTPIPKRRVVNESIDCLPSPIRAQTPKFNYVVNKEKVLPVRKRVLTPRCKENETIRSRAGTPTNNKAQRGVLPFGIPGNKFGLIAPKPVVIPKKEEMKTMIAQKTNLAKNTVDTRRGMIKGVRSNRRFELLMNMRKGKN